MLWIDFKLCSYFWFDNPKVGEFLNIEVVNWFQIMFLFLVRQPNRWRVRKALSCELISNYVLIFGSTTRPASMNIPAMLWIDFKLCSYFWFDNQAVKMGRKGLVVNWFQIMFLFLVRQLLLKVSIMFNCCELISNYVLIFGSTTNLFMILELARCELISNYVLIFGSTTQ